MVKIEATREPDYGDDPRKSQRKRLADWFHKNQRRIRIQETDTGREYTKAMTAWGMAGKRSELKPFWAGCGEKSILDVLGAAERVSADSDAVVVLVDDRKARSAIMQPPLMNVEVVSTQTFVRQLHERYGVDEAKRVWRVIEIAARRNG